MTKLTEVKKKLEKARVAIGDYGYSRQDVTATKLIEEALSLIDETEKESKHKAYIDIAEPEPIYGRCNNDCILMDFYGGCLKDWAVVKDIPSLSSCASIEMQYPGPQCPKYKEAGNDNKKENIR